MSLLDDIVAQKRWEVATQKRLLSERELRDRIGLVPRARDFAAALGQGAGPRVVAEFKRASPSRGAIRPAADPAKVCSAYAEAGAVALSVLTDHRWFWGSLLDLWRAREAVSRPILRKDFIVDAYQVYEARAHGADAVLLICAILDDGELRELTSLAKAIGMTPVVEAHDEKEIERALAADAPVVGLNNRDLRSMTVKPRQAERLRPHVPSDRLTIAESGLRTREELERAASIGFHACLVGEALMAAEEPGAALRTLLGR